MNLEGREVPCFCCCRARCAIRRAKAALLSRLIVKLTWNFIHTGSYRSRLMQRRFQKQMTDPDPYNRAFVAMTGRDRCYLSFITKESIQNQFSSDLTAPLPVQFAREGTEVHVFYAKKMGEKYLERYKTVFRDPVIHEHDLRHEELLGVYPEKWCELVERICLSS